MKNFNNKQLGILILILLALIAIPFAWVGTSQKVSSELKSNVPPMPLASGQVAASSVASSRALVSNPSNPVAGKNMWPAPAETWGVKLEPRSAAYAAALRSGQKLKGRTGPLDVASMASPAKLKEGDELTIPLLGGDQVTGRVQLVMSEANGVVRVGGKLTGDEVGTFALAQLPDQITGSILLPNRGIAYVITPGEDGGTWLVEKALSDVICLPYPQATSRAVSPKTTATAAAVTVPLLSSRPTAPAVIYIDLDGETVKDPDWNGGATIVAPPYALTTTQIREIWNRVKEDYLPFNIDVTTNVARYNNTAPGLRMRCIVTSNDAAEPGAGGVARIDSFSGAGTSLSSTIPCWVFNSSPDTIAAAISHEIGHTVGLKHDGITSPHEEYYDGHGTGLVSWGPIMGSGYYSVLTQWSKGEYAGANNQEDDLAIISRPENGFGYILDDAGNSIATAAALSLTGRSINQSGTISKTGDMDCFAVNARAGVINVSATHAEPAPNLDIRLDLLDSSGAIIATSNPSTETNASLSRTVTAGTYYVRVSGTGRGNVLLDGYSNYGSLGAYTLTGDIPGAGQRPVIISSGTASLGLDTPFNYQIIATNNPASYGISGTMPAGLTLNTQTGEISGTPTEDGTFSFIIMARNALGVGSKILVINGPADDRPLIDSAATATGFVESVFSYQITATNDPTSFSLTGVLPVGLTFDSATGLISGTPSIVGASTVTLGATNGSGTGSQDLLLTIAPKLTLATAVNDPLHPWATGGNAKWTIITSGASDGLAAAKSGKIANRKHSSIRTMVKGPATLTFRWRVNCERGYDFLRFSIDGIQKTSITGYTDWSTRSIAIPRGNHLVQWDYTKDYSFSIGEDAGYLDTVSIK